MASMFASAKKVAKPSTKAKKEKAQIEISGLLDSAAIDALIKQLSAVKETIDGDVKSQMNVEFIRLGVAKKGRPDNFEGTDGDLVKSGCELRARASTSPLTDAVADILIKADLPVETIETTVDAFIINPAYSNDSAILAKVEKALSGIKGLPEDFIMKQDGATKKIVGKDAIEKLFSTITDVKKIAELLPLAPTP